MKIKSEKTEKDIINNAYGKGIKLSPLSQYYKNNEENKNIYVMNYSSLDSEKIEYLISMIKYILKKPYHKGMTYQWSCKNIKKKKELATSYFRTMYYLRRDDA